MEVETATTKLYKHQPDLKKADGVAWVFDNAKA